MVNYIECSYLDDQFDQKQLCSMFALETVLNRIK